jgi:mono/diheme cytochrome c family protein
MRAAWTTFAALLAVGSACSDGGRTELSPLAQQGQRVYQNVCIACHNGDPTKDGSAGPAIAGSSRELIEARVVHGSYPPAYTPKRPGNAMPRFEYLAKDVDALAAYLGQVGNAGGATASKPSDAPAAPADPPTG